MALVLPILLMLTFGAVDYGYFFFIKNTLQGAAQAAVRAAIVPGAANSDVTSAVSNVLTPAGLKSGTYAVTTSPVDVSTAATGTNVSVTVSCSWGTVGFHDLPTALGGIADSKQVQGLAVMRKE